MLGLDLEEKKQISQILILILIFKEKNNQKFSIKQIKQKVENKETKQKFE
jgi:hypothetical protein